MNVLKKSSVGTLGAYPYEQDGCPGISIGFCDKEKKVVTGIVSLEVEDGKTILVINDKLFQEKVDKIKHI